MFKISIPNPCFEGWDNMTSNEQGRHCNSCSKTVVDFSVMSDEMVQQYFKDNHGQKICGHFKNAQLQRIIIDLPGNILHVQLPYWKRFLVAFLISFGAFFLSIDTTIAGIPFEQNDTFYQKSFSGAGKKKKKKNRKLQVEIKPIDYEEIIFTMGLIARDPVFEKKTESTTDGYCIIKQQPDSGPTAQVSFDSINQVEKNVTDTGTVIKNNTGGHSPVNPANKNLPRSNTAFILPDALAARKQISKKKKV